MDTAVVPYMFVLVPGVVGAFLMNRWQRRRSMPAHDADRRAWLAYVLPLLIAVEAYALALGGAAFVLTVVTNPALHSANGKYFMIGGIVGLAGLTLLFAVIDVLAIMNARRAARNLMASEIS